MRLRQHPPLRADDDLQQRQLLHATLRENAVLSRELAAVQERCTRLLAERHAEIVRLQADLMRTRADAIVQRSAAAAARDEAQALRAAVPGLPRRIELVGHIERLMEMLRRLRRDRLGPQLQQEREAREDSARRAASAPVAEPQPAAAPTPIVPLPPLAAEAPPDPAHAAIPSLGDLREKAVLCVAEGGLAALSQRLVEIAGGHFLRHDADGDGIEGDPAALEASLHAADLVICQTGCLSHGAYWRVQDHCRRTGKQCVLVSQPQAIRIVRAGQREAPAVQTAGTE